MTCIEIGYRETRERGFDREQDKERLNEFELFFDTAESTERCCNFSDNPWRTGVTMQQTEEIRGKNMSTIHLEKLVKYDNGEQPE